MPLLLTLIALLTGGWMVFDGIHVLARGKYFGPDKPGPWSNLFMAMGIDPFSLGPLFIALGILWLVFLAATLGGKRWGQRGAVLTAIASQWYLPVGTILSIAYLALQFAFHHGSDAKRLDGPSR